MNIIVLMKRTFDTEGKIKIVDNQIVEDGVEYIINPYDEYAIEEGIKIREEFGGTVTVISVGSSAVEKEMRTALAMGADQGVLIEVELDEMAADELTIAHILAAALKEREFDLILAGNLAVDTGAGQVASRVAELLDIPQVTTITKLTLAEKRARAERDVEGDLELVETSLPALFTAQQGLNEPRYPTLPGIMRAKKKPLERITLVDLGLGEDQIRSKTSLTQLFAPAPKEAGRILTGDVCEQVQELVQLLRDEARVI